MGKVKLKKQDIWIDMTPMSDVMVLLLCFFMLTNIYEARASKGGYTVICV